MTDITIDIGNSATKIDLWNDEGLLYRLDETEVTPALIEKLIEREGVQGVIVASVRNDPDTFIQELKSNTKALVVDFNYQEIESHYDLSRYQSRIGADRIAAYLGAERLFPHTSKLIIDTGTAITIDVADHQGLFCGGNISAGLMTRMKTLVDNTSMLPEVRVINGNQQFGHDTLQAIACGAQNGVTGEILYSIKMAKHSYGIKKIALTGGDSKRIYEWLREGKDAGMIFQDPYLVGRGLDYHFRKYYLGER